MACGSAEPESAKDQKCAHCGLYWSNRGIVSHENSCDWQEFDCLHPAAVEDVDDDLGGRAGADPSDATRPTDSDGGVPDAVGDTPEPSTATTDGGTTLAPPEPDVVEDDQEDDEDDHLIPVEEYFEEFERANPETAETRKYREWKQQMSDRFTHVDTEKTTRTEVEFIAR